MSDVVGIQLLGGGRVAYYQAAGHAVKLDSLYVVETEHGPGIGRAVKARITAKEIKGSDPMRRILREAAPKDLEQSKANEQLEREAYRLCRKLVMDKSLSMKLVDVVYTLDGRKSVFYFTSENRVDFRELVKELAHALKVKIEMRQIGVRDEARRLGGVGCCGQSLCCCTFLKDFVSVSIRMAKDQNVSLNPTKVSGICGRLMCCLSYEYEGGKGKPKKGSEGKPAVCAPAAEGGAEAPCRECPAEAHPNHRQDPRERFKSQGQAKYEKPRPGGAPEAAGGPAKPQPAGQLRRWFKQRQGGKPEANTPNHGNGGRGGNKGPSHGRPHGQPPSWHKKPEGPKS